MRPVLLAILCVMFVGCGRTAKDYAEEFDEIQDACFSRYLEGNPEERYSAMKQLVGCLREARPGIWRHRIRGEYEAIIFGRASIAAADQNYRSESDEFRRLAVLAWRRREEWNSTQQKLLPITPAPEIKTAERELFTLIANMDRVLRENIGKPAPNLAEREAEQRRMDKVVNEVAERRKQKSMEK